MPVTQQGGVHMDVPDWCLILFSFQSVKDYQSCVFASKQMPRLLDRTMVQMQKDVSR